MLTSPPHRILVTGASGLLGQSLVLLLLDNGFITHILLRPQAVSPFIPHSNLIIHRGDMTDVESLIKALRHVDAVVHLAANKYHPTLSHTVNVQGAYNLKQTMLKTNVRRLINITSQSTKISRRGVYGTTKKLSDQILHDPQVFQVTTLAPSLVYGNDSTSLFHTIAHYVKSLPLVPIFGNGNWRLFPIWVGDVSTAIIACLNRPQTIGKTYDLGCNRSLTMNQLVDKIAYLFDKPSHKLHLPIWLGLFGAKLLRLFTDDPSVTEDNVLGSTQDSHCNPARAIRELQLKPLPVDIGLRQVLLPPTDAIKILIIGAGKMGLLHTAILTILPQARVVAIVDTNPHLRQTASTFGSSIPTFADLNSAIPATHPNIAFICTPTHTHFSLAQDCLRQGLHVFIEKPTTPNFATTKRLIKLSHHYPQLKIFTGYYYLYRPLYKLAKTLLHQNILGPIKSFTGTMIYGEVFGPKRGWLFDPQKSGGGVLINPSPHLFSLLVNFFGLPKQVACTTRKIYSQLIEDEARVRLIYRQGIQGRVTVSWSRPGLPIVQNRLFIRGTHGTLKLTNNELIINSPKINTIINQADLPEYQRIFNLNPVQGAEGYYLQDQAAIQSLTKKSHSLTSLKLATQVERLISLCYQSDKAQKPIQV